MGKYDKVVARKELQERERLYGIFGGGHVGASSRDERIQVEMEKFREEFPKVSDVAREYAKVRAERTHLEGLLSVVNERLAVVTLSLLPKFEEEDLSSVKLDTGQTISVQREPYASVTDKETYRTWCIENGHQNEMMLPWQTTNAMTKERLLQGEPEPDGVEAFVLEKLVLRKK